MTYSSYLPLLVATLCSPTPNDEAADDTTKPLPDLSAVLEASHQQLKTLVEDFHRHPLSPAQTQQFEQQLQETLRELGRQLVQQTYNHLEPDNVQVLDKHVLFENTAYTRLNSKTAQHVWTLFGPIRLRRVGYRPTEKNGEPTLFPLAVALGLVAGASPALAERAAWLLGTAGMTQQRVLQRLRQDHGVGWGVKKLRQVTAAVAAALAEQRHEVQVEKLLEWLKTATATTGRHKPVLSAGRDGITLGERGRGEAQFPVATTGTLSVLDRKGKRLGTVYLACVPESRQGTMSRQLTALVQAVLERWQGPLPRLCYVTDAGDNETRYYDKVLKTMRHPRTAEPLEWIRVVDYYHACEYIGKMAELLFGKGRQAVSWTRKMQKWLLKPGGVNRVLHSAAALRQRYGLRGQARQEFQSAYRYLRKRMRYMRYAEYRRVGVPLGSGVTESACKQVYTARLKLSGMRWQKEGAQTILDLRVILLSDVWEQAYQRVLESRKQVQVGAWGPPCEKENQNAA
jgi:hypothetical protein